MMRSMFAAVSGLKDHQTMLDVVANDLANVNTIGYKASRVTFSNQLAQLTQGASGAGAGLGGSNAQQVGLGVSVGSIDNLMDGGSMQSTGNPLDVAIEGEGWFRVAQGAPPATPTGPVPLPAGSPLEYGRAGNFTTNGDGYLTTQDGWFVIGRSASGGGGTDQFINIPAGSSDVKIGEDGAVRYTPAGGGAPVVAGYLSLAKFANETGLVRSSGSRWQASPASGTEQVATPGGTYGQTVAGTLEMSNVDMAQEFTSMITAQRGFEASSRVISTADEMLQTLSNMKR